MLLVVVAFAHFDSAFCQDILAHFSMFNLLQIQFSIFCIHHRTTLYQLQGKDCVIPEIDHVTADMTQS